LIVLIQKNVTGVNASKTQSKQKSRIVQLKSTTAADKQSAGDSVHHVGFFLTSLSFQDFYPCNFNYHFFLVSHCWVYRLDATVYNVHRVLQQQFEAQVVPDL